MSTKSNRKLRILLTNDDGPPSVKSGHSPFIYPFAKGLLKELDCEVKIVVPSRQRSWAGKSYVIVDETTGKYFYPNPTSEDGTDGDLRDLPRKPHELDADSLEMILLDGTPATCASIALHNLYPPDSFDFVISGPNFGRNTSSSFALSSGTLGAALAASLSGTPGIALSWGLMEGYKPPGQDLVDAAVKLSCDVIKRLYSVGWGEGANKVDVYSVNVPLMPSIVENPRVQWTSMAITGYGRLFKSLHERSTPSSSQVDDAGPAAIPEPTSDDPERGSENVGSESLLVKPEHYEQPLAFEFKPDIGHLVNPPLHTMKPREDRTALHEGMVSVTPVRAAFAEASPPTGIAVEGGLWKL
ncbi:hypothetical protein JCM10212_005988 [Sporobolomyces blumeae]